MRLGRETPLGRGNTATPTCNYNWHVWEQSLGMRCIELYAASETHLLRTHPESLTEYGANSAQRLKREGCMSGGIPIRESRRMDVPAMGLVRARLWLQKAVG